MADKKTALSLKLNERALIIEIMEGPLTPRLLAMGVTPRSTCVILQKAPFGGAAILGLDHHQIAMRDEELAYIIVDLDKDKVS